MSSLGKQSQSFDMTELLFVVVIYTALVTDSYNDPTYPFCCIYCAYAHL